MKNLQENLKLFYLGLKGDEPYLYKNKDLTTHAAIIGMTGSGKTGLGITLLEEAAIDNIPAFVIDPKGDLTNLCLAFNDLCGDDFLPYIDENEANNQNLSAAELAEKTAQTWQKGLESCYQNKERISLMNESAEFRIYTPKSTTGLNVSLLSDFVAPNLEGEELNEYVLSIATSLLSLLGMPTDNSNSPEMVLLQNIFIANFAANKTVTISDLINQITNPPFEKIGVFDVDSFFSSDKRMAFAMKLNSLFANPSFVSWCDGERLDISKMLFNDQRKARCNIFTISHLNDSERMFFVTLLLNEIIRWMRTTQGTSALRAILYMDEIYGFFPPNGNPPSKTPMLTLLKQARAYGLGCVLSTQNPVDLDYKGLSNIGTWFIGRLQTQQDKERVIAGLTGIGSGISDKSEIMDLISNLKKREFLVKNINSDALEIISSRFALSYLAGPLSKEQISNLMKSKKSGISAAKSLNLSDSAPLISPEIPQIYSVTTSKNVKPYLVGNAKVRYVSKDYDVTKDVQYCLNLDGCDAANWDEASSAMDFSATPKQDELKYETLPNFVTKLKNFKEEERKFKDFVFRNAKLSLYSALGLKSNPDESKEAFLLRVKDKCEEEKEKATEAFEAKFEKEKARLEKAIAKANEKLEREKAQAKSSLINSALNIGSAIAGALLGSKKLSTTNITKMATGAKSASKMMNDKKDVALAEESVEALSAEFEKYIEDGEEKIAQIAEKYDIKNIQIDEVQISPKKSDIFDENIALLWKS